MIGFYNYTVILTYLGAVSGFLGITYISGGNLRTALICLMVSGFCDMFDGKIASTMKRTTSEKRFGIQIDSLSDLVCFGVLPAMIGFHCGGGKPMTVLICAVYMLCALIRLAWFNVDEEERQNQSADRREVYLGLPVTSSGLLIPLFISAGCLLKLPLMPAAPWLLLAIAGGFLTPFHMKKPGMAGLLVMALMGFATFAAVLIGVSA